MNRFSASHSLSRTNTKFGNKPKVWEHLVESERPAFHNTAVQEGVHSVSCACGQSTSPVVGGLWRGSPINLVELEGFEIHLFRAATINLIKVIVHHAWVVWFQTSELSGQRRGTRQEEADMKQSESWLQHSENTARRELKVGTKGANPASQAL